MIFFRNSQHIWRFGLLPPAEAMTGKSLHVIVVVKDGKDFNQGQRPMSNNRSFEDGTFALIVFSAAVAVVTMTVFSVLRLIRFS